MNGMIRGCAPNRPAERNSAALVVEIAAATAAIHHIAVVAAHRIQIPVPIPADRQRQDHDVGATTAVAVHNLVLQVDHTTNPQCRLSEDMLNALHHRPSVVDTHPVSDQSSIMSRF